MAVTLAYDDDVSGNMDSWVKTAAFDDGTKGNNNDKRGL